MALKRKMTRKEMVNFLDHELIPQTKQEIGNWIHPRKKQGGYFVVVRQIFCMVDFLGAVYNGYPLSERVTDRNGRHIATSNKAIKFILKFFKPKKTYQVGVVSKLYKMYRHGLVHLYQPRTLKLNGNKRLLWFFYRGKRFDKKITVGTDLGKIIFFNVKHLKIIINGPSKKRYYLPICVDSLYEDFENAVQSYRNKLENTKTLQVKWRTTVNAICKPR
jgi:hypothetical protein